MEKFAGCHGAFMDSLLKGEFRHFRSASLCVRPLLLLSFCYNSFIITFAFISEGAQFSLKNIGMESFNYFNCFYLLPPPSDNRSLSD